MAFAVFQPLKVLPRIRLAPGFALTDSNGALITSEDTRGQLTIYAFAPVDCDDECAGVEATLSEVQARLAAGEVDLGDTTFQIVTVALDSGGDPARLAEAAERSRADGTQWVWAGASDENVKTIVGAGFGRYFENRPGGLKFDQSLVLVDGWGWSGATTSSPP